MLPLRRPWLASISPISKGENSGILPTHKVILLSWTHGLEQTWHCQDSNSCSPNNRANTFPLHLWGAPSVTYMDINIRFTWRPSPILAQQELCIKSYIPKRCHNPTQYHCQAWIIVTTAIEAITLPQTSFMEISRSCRFLWCNIRTWNMWHNSSCILCDTTPHAPGTSEDISSTTDWRFDPKRLTLEQLRVCSRAQQWQLGVAGIWAHDILISRPAAQCLLQQPNVTAPPLPLSVAQPVDDS